VTDKWIVGRPGGPSGPFYSIVSSSGRVIAMQIADEQTATYIVQLHNRTLDFGQVVLYDRTYSGN
jgi:hypothetical protein